MKKNLHRKVQNTKKAIFLSIPSWNLTKFFLLAYENLLGVVTCPKRNDSCSCVFMPNSKPCKVLHCNRSSNLIELLCTMLQLDFPHVWNGVCIHVWYRWSKWKAIALEGPWSLIFLLFLPLYFVNCFLLLFGYLCNILKINQAGQNKGWAQQLVRSRGWCKIINIQSSEVRLYTFTNIS